MWGVLSKTLHMLADLSAATVRNTFLEFQDVDGADVLEASGFPRQCSEPVTPFQRQVSDHTTASSCPTAEGDATEGYTTDPDDGGMHARAKSSKELLVQQRARPESMKAPGKETPALRFCPNCGSKVEPLHRFCPFCRYQLRPWEASDSRTAAPSLVSQRSDLDSPSLLLDLQRFRFLEARPSDIEMARVACMGYLREDVGQQDSVAQFCAFPCHAQRY